jgi:hypothetical protein
MTMADSVYLIAGSVLLLTLALSSEGCLLRDPASRFGVVLILRQPASWPARFELWLGPLF